ncbi:hypothetical protein SCHPADRAFT_866725 [Schizopora paradoxa]|uniref:Peptidase A22B, signal peptide peptidase n=1 Tax=Schizopora paradoxa TaxID=27342 RepID=A0A0H2S2X9_9AGAM|nr:hypothetical protein SCHPADRAFT_866725 [Schizopora paradoxa]
MTDVDWDLLSSYAGILSLATISVYSGSYGSLKAPPKPKDQRTDDDDEDDAEDIGDRLSTSDAYMFPLIGSAMLLGLYLIVVYLGSEWINFFLTWYFAVFGVGSVWKCAISISRTLVGARKWKTFAIVKLEILKAKWEILSLSMRLPSLFLFPLAVVPSAIFILYPDTKSAILTNVMALSFAHSVLSFGKIDTFATGCVLLSGLFLYDIWWVFGTEVMVKVATSLDAPIKILWAKSLTFETKRGFTMLGLGDIVVPGMFVALALRYDFNRSKRKAITEPFAKPYFTSALTAYVLGLVTTMTVMHTFKAAQPALLYLSPACILSFFATALARGELKEAWAWSDGPEESKDNKTAAVTNDESPAVAETALTVGSADKDGHSADDREGAEHEGDSDQKMRKRKG